MTNYEAGRVWWGIDEEDYLKIVPTLREYESELRTAQMHDAADEILSYILFIEATWRRLGVVSKRIYPLIEAMDRYHRGKNGLDTVQAAYERLLTPTGAE